MFGLPVDACTWRVDRLPPAEELAAFAIERNDIWMKALVDAVLRQPVTVPAETVRIPRPGALNPDPVPARVTTDVRQIAQFLKTHTGRG